MARAPSRFGEMVQWDTSDHDWLEGRGGKQKLYLIAMIDDATSRALARFVEGGQVSSSAFNITATNGTPRQLQLALKLLF